MILPQQVARNDSLIVIMCRTIAMGRDASLIEKEEKSMMSMKRKSHQVCDKLEVGAHKGGGRNPKIWLIPCK